MIKDFRKTIKLTKKFKMVISVSFDILQLPHTAISNSEKLNHLLSSDVSQPPVIKEKFRRLRHFFRGSFQCLPVDKPSAGALK